MNAPFQAGEQVLLIDQKGRGYLLTLQQGGIYHTHGGTLPHDVLLGRPEGFRVEASGGMILVAFRPRFADYALKMKRGAQVVYPKDLGPILTYGDVFPGARVLEAGTGSGSLTIAICRAVGREGRVVSYEVREEHRAQAIRNIEGAFGKLPEQLELRLEDLVEVGRTGETFDRCVLDLPEPWAPLEALHAALEPGAVLCSYLPTTGQVQQLVGALPAQGFLHIETFETLRRSWHVTERSVRPDHRMIGHTGFLTVARALA
ncbi:MAG TPA: tRNA (adenine-N1)-methyltransferase [Actinomycetota bacterium]|nr:tRNA (adenine-N1)-methyltransferase [Actinomycetota bacterium]